MPRRIRNLPSLFDTKILGSLSHEAQKVIEEVLAKQSAPKGVLESLEPVGFQPPRPGHDTARPDFDPFTKERPVYPYEAQAAPPEIQLPQKPVDPELAAEAARLPAMQDASEALRQQIGEPPVHGQPPSHLVDRNTPVGLRRISGGHNKGTVEVQRMFGPAEPEFGAELQEGTWLPANEHDMRFREGQARRQKELKAIDKGVYDFDNGPGAWQEEWDKTLVRPRFYAGEEQLQVTPRPIEEVINESIINDTPRGAYYGEVEVPEGRGFTLDPKTKAGQTPPDETPGIKLLTLGDITRATAKKTGTGEVQDYMASHVPWDDDIEATVQQLETEADFDRSLLQPVWDRIHGTYKGTDAALEDEGKNAKSSFFNFLGDLLNHARNAALRKEGAFGGRVTKLDPNMAAEEQSKLRAHHAAMAAYAHNRQFTEGVQSGGFAERQKKVDLTQMYNQLEQEGDSIKEGPGFQGSRVSAEDREMNKPGGRTLEVEEDYEVGQQPLQALRRNKSGAVIDQLENLRRGIVDLAVVPRGTVQVGHARFGDVEPYETEVLKVIPFRPTMKSGYLEDVSRRLMLPTRTLLDAIQGEMEYDLIQVRKPRGKVGADLPPEGRTRHPDDIVWWEGQKGLDAKARMAKHPKVLEELLHDPEARVVRAMQGRGMQILGITYRRGKPIAIGELDPRTGRHKLYRLRADEADQLTFRYDPSTGKPYQGKPIQSSILEKGIRGDSIIQDSDGVTTPFFKGKPDPIIGWEGDPQTWPGWEVREPNTEKVFDHLGRELTETQANNASSAFSRGAFHEEEHGGKPVVRKPKRGPDDKILKDKNGNPILETMEEAKARVLSEGVTPHVSQRVTGIKFSEQPIREDIASKGVITWMLAKPPQKYGATDEGGFRETAHRVRPFGWQVAENPSRAGLTVVFTAVAPNKADRNKLAEFNKGKTPDKHLVNPTAEDLRWVLQHTNIRQVAIQIEEPALKGESANLVHRVKAVVHDAMNPRRTRADVGIQKKGNPNWVETKDPITGASIFTPKVGVKLPPSGGSELQGIEVPGLQKGLTGDARAAEAARIAEINKANNDLAGYKKLTGAEKKNLAKTGLTNPSPEGTTPLPATPPPGPQGFRDTMAAIQQRRMQAAYGKLRDIFPDMGSGTKKALGYAGLAGGLMLASQMVPGENQAEAAAGRKIKTKMKVSAEAAEAMHAAPTHYIPEFAREWMAKHLNFFEPMFDTAHQALGMGAEQSLRNTMATQHGGIVGQASIRYEPIRLMREKFDKIGQTENLSFFLKKAQNLYAWDRADAQKIQLEADAIKQTELGNHREARVLRAEAKRIDDQMAQRMLTEFGGTKESEIQELKDLHQLVGGDMYAAFQKASKVVYRGVQQMLDELHDNGQLTEEEWADFKKQGLDYIPNLTTTFAQTPDGQLRWTGGRHITQFASDTKGVTNFSVGRDAQDERILADPLTAAARLITEGTAQMARTKMAQKTVKVFSRAGMARKVDPKTNPKNQQGWDFYSFMENGQQVTYEMPKQVVDSLLMADTDFTKRFVQNLPGHQAMGVVRGISEAGATTANFGWAALQAGFYDPAAAMMQIPSKDARIVRRIIPFMGGVIKNSWDNLKTANLPGRASSPLREEAARANVLFAGSSADLADFSTIEGRDTSGRTARAFRDKKYGEGINRSVRHGLNVLSDRFTRPLDEAVKMTSWDMLRKEKAKGLNGYTQEQMDYLARTRGGSGDWNQRGSQDDWVRTFISFGRPAMLANETAIRSGYQQPKKLAKVAIATLAMMGARRYMNSYAAQELGIDQDELEKRYSAYDQDNNLLFMLPPSWAAQMNNGEGMEIGANGIERPFALKIPLAPIMRVWMAPLKGIAKAYETGNPAHLIAGGAVGTLDELLPGSVPLRYDTMGNAAGAVGRRIGSVLPAVYRLPIEQFADKQFFTGAPIVGSRLQDRAPEDQYSSSTETFYKDLGHALGASPNRLQHLGRGVAPGGFQLIPQLYNKMMPLPKDAEGNRIAPVEQSPTERLNSIPLLGEFTKRFTPQRYEEDLSSSQDQFYDLSNQTKSSAAAINDFENGVSTSLPSQMTQYLAAINPDVQGLVRQLSEISDAQKQVMNSATMTPREKRDAMVEMQNIKRAALRQFLAVPEIQSVVGGQVPEQ